jgi:nicotinate-nucleotide--dimethylbenzimidazole phosphoribosyltransferase
MTWPRPVPLIGDTSSARERAEDLDGWAFPPQSRQALADIVAARRDVRRFRPDAVPEDVLERLLAAGHAAPSVGHSQPWRFLLVEDAGTRERAALLADRERLAQAAQLDPASARRLLDLQLEGIREAPLGVVVCCDRRVPAAGVLGRATFPDADLWSCACAIQNIWLTARAEGLGLGWVTLFRPEDLAELLGLPDGVVTLGWLCVGWPDERPPAPGLERAGWSRRQPLSSVVVHGTWPAAAEASGTTQPLPPPSRLRAPEPARVVAARDVADELLTTPGALGVLDRAVDRLLAAGVDGEPGGSLVLAAGRHLVTRHAVSAYDPTVTDDVLSASRAGRSLAATAARDAGLQLVVLDGGGSTGDLVNDDALSDQAVRELVDRGRAAGLSASGGVVALGEVGVGNTTVAAALTAAALRCPADEVVGLGAGADTAMVERKRDVVQRAVKRALSGSDDEPPPQRLLATLGGPELALLVGVVLGAAERRAVVVLDGLATSISALLAVRLEPAVAGFLVAGQRSREAAHPMVLAELGLEPLLDLRLRAGEGVGAALAVRLLTTGLAIRTSAATTSGAPPGSRGAELRPRR